MFDFWVSLSLGPHLTTRAAQIGLEHSASPLTQNARHGHGLKNKRSPKLEDDRKRAHSRWVAIHAIREADLGYPTELVVRYLSIISAGVVSTLHTGDPVFLILLTVYLSIAFISTQLFLRAKPPISRTDYAKLLIFNCSATGIYAGAVMYSLTFGTLEMIALAVCGMVGLGLYITVRHRVFSAFTYWDIGLVLVTWAFFGTTILLSVDGFWSKTIVVMASLGAAFYFVNAQNIAIQTHRELDRTRDSLVELHRSEAQAKQSQIQELSRDLAHTSRLNMMGEMATTLAHELNQPLTSIVQNMDAARIVVNKNLEGPELSILVSETEIQAHRAGGIIRTLRDFVRNKDVSTEAFDLVELLHETAQLVGVEASAEGIAVKLDIKSEATAFGSRIQISQVIVNLFRNAIEAILDSDPDQRQITVSLARADEWVEVSVADTGAGFDDDFDPFARFASTKKGGIGLGLSICESIIEAHSGRLWFDTNSSQTRFCFSLPIATT